MMGLWAAAAGAAVGGGLWLLIAGLVGTRRTVEPAPPSWWRAQRRRLRAWLDRRRLRHLVVAAVVGMAVWILTGWPVAGAAVAVGVLVLPRVLSGRAAQRRIARLEALEQWSRQLSDVLASGAGLEQTLLTTADTAPAAISDEVAALATRLRLRTPTEAALRVWADDIDDAIGDLIAGTLILAAHARGRGLREVLSSLADTVARDVASRREVEADRATHRTTARWMVAALAAYGVFGLLDQAYVAPFASLSGQVALACVTGLYAAALWWMHRLATANPAPRFLPGPERFTKTAGVVDATAATTTAGEGVQ